MGREEDLRAKKKKVEYRPKEEKSKAYIYSPEGARLNMKESPAEPPEPKYEVWQIKRPEERD